MSVHSVNLRPLYAVVLALGAAVCLAAAPAPPAGEPAPAAVRSPVIAHWSFDQPANDKKMYNDSNAQTPHPATPENPAEVDVYAGEAPFGNAVVLNGRPGSFFNVPVLSNFQNAPFTISVWVYLASPGQYMILSDWNDPKFSYQFGFEKGPGGERPENLACEMRSPDVNASERNKPVERQKNGISVVRSSFDAPLRIGRWHHIAFVWDRDQNNPNNWAMTEYVDGKFFYVAFQQYQKSGEVLANDRPAKIGYREMQRWLFNGALDELWIFGRALSKEEVVAVMRHNNPEGTGPLAKVIKEETPTAVALAPTPTPTPANPVPTVVEVPAPAPTVVETPPTVVEQAPPPPVVAVAPPVRNPSRPPRGRNPANPTIATAPPPAAPAPAPSIVQVPSMPADDPAASAATDPAVSHVAAALPRIDSGPAELAKAPQGYGPGRLAGIIACVSLEVLLAGYFFWVIGERAKLSAAASRA